MRVFQQYNNRKEKKRKYLITDGAARVSSGCRYSGDAQCGGRRKGRLPQELHLQEHLLHNHHLLRQRPTVKRQVSARSLRGVGLLQHYWGRRRTSFGEGLPSSASSCRSECLCGWSKTLRVQLYESPGRCIRHIFYSSPRNASKANSDDFVFWQPTQLWLCTKCFQCHWRQPCLLAWHAQAYGHWPILCISSSCLTSVRTLLGHLGLFWREQSFLPRCPSLGRVTEPFS